MKEIGALNRRECLSVLIHAMPVGDSFGGDPRIWLANT